MGPSILEEAKAVQTGFWPLYRYNPALEAEGKPAFTLDYQKPDGTMPELLAGEDRYADLNTELPKDAAKLQADLEADCNKQYDILKNGVL